MTTLRLLALLGYSLALFFFARHVGYLEGSREVAAVQKQLDTQSEMARAARIDGPIVRVGIVNARLRRLLQSRGIDPVKEGVYAK